MCVRALEDLDYCRKFQPTTLDTILFYHIRCWTFELELKTYRGIPPWLVSTSNPALTTTLPKQNHFPLFPLLSFHLSLNHPTFILFTTRKPGGMIYVNFLPSCCISYDIQQKSSIFGVTWPPPHALRHYVYIVGCLWSSLATRSSPSFFKPSMLTQRLALFPVLLVISVRMDQFDLIDEIQQRVLLWITGLMSSKYTWF